MSAGRPRARVYLTAEETRALIAAFRVAFGGDDAPDPAAAVTAAQKLDRALSRLNHNTKGAA